MVYSVNPLKVIVVLLTVINRLSAIYPLLKFKASVLENALNQLGNLIIKGSTSIQEVEDMVLDKLYNNIEVLDMLAYLDNIPILQNPVIDVIVSRLYYGPYQREFFLKNCLCYDILANDLTYFPGKESLATSKLTLFRYSNKLGYTNKVYAQKFKRLGSKIMSEKSQQKSNLGEKKQKVGHMFQFLIWKKSLDVKYIFNAVIAFAIAITMQIYSVLMIT